MARFMTIVTSLAVAATLSLAGPAEAQDNIERVAVKQDWSVFADGNPIQCWIVVRPKNSVNTRDGRTVNVRRGQIRLYVSFRPHEKAMGEVSFLSGYPFAEGSTADLTIGDEKFRMVTSTKDETAWPLSPAVDKEVVDAMKRGSEAVVEARSSRGTRTRDTFSLIGFTAAFREAEKRCGG